MNEEFFFKFKKFVKCKSLFNWITKLVRNTNKYFQTVVEINNICRIAWQKKNENKKSK